MNRVIGKALGPDLRLVARPLCRIDHQRETNPEDARPGLLEPEGADVVVKLLAGHVVAGPEKAHPAIQHPHVIKHALRQLGVQHPRPKLETRVRTFCIVDAEHMPEPQEEPRRHTQDSPGLASQGRPSTLSKRTRQRLFTINLSLAPEPMHPRDTVVVTSPEGPDLKSHYSIVRHRQRRHSGSQHAAASS